MDAQVELVEFGAIEPGRIELGALLALPRNPKEHDVGGLHSSIGRFGFLDRLIVNVETGRLLAGHGRVEALMQKKNAGEEPPFGIDLDDGGRWLVPVDFVSVPEDQEEAAALALNGVQEQGGWDDGLLAQVLRDVVSKDGPHGLLGTGFDTDDVDRLLREAERMANLSLSQLTGQEDHAQAPAGDPGQADEAGQDSQEGESGGRDIASGKDGLGLPTDEEILAEYPVQPGDVWGFYSPSGVLKHAVVCGDAAQDTSWRAGLTALGRPFYNGLVTSPPYAEQRKSTYGGIAEGEYVRWWGSIQSNAARFLASDGSFFVNIKPNVVDGQRTLYVMDMALAMVRQWGWKLIDEFAWRRISSPGSWPNRFKNGFDPVYHFARQTEIKFRPKQASHPGEGMNIGSGHNDSTNNYYNTRDGAYEWDAALPSNCIGQFGNAMKSGHPAAFPPLLPMFFMAGFSDIGDLWCDPFCGAGSTIVAAEKSMRACVGIEKLPLYVARTLDNVYRSTGLVGRKVQV